MATGAAARRVLAGLFRPAARLLGRLRYAQKFAVVGLVLLVPLGFVAGAYVDLQRDQIAFSAKERSGVVLMGPLVDLTAHLVQERHQVATGARVTADLTSRLADIDRANEQVNQELDTGDAWRDTRRLVLDAQAAGTHPSAYDIAVDSLLALIVRVGDASNLTLDPDIDSYYLVDTLQFRLPVLLDVAGRGSDTAASPGGPDGTVAGPGGPSAEVTMQLGLNHGVITDMRKALARAASAVVNQTADPGVRAGAQTGFDRLDAATAKLDGALSASITAGRLDGVAAPAALVLQEATAFASWAAVALDRLLRTRISGFTNRALRVGLGSSAAALLALYLFAGFYLSVSRPIRRIVDTLRGVASGDLTRRVFVDTRDEVGFVSVALNDTIARTEVATERLAARATHDPLTHLPNRDYVLHRLTETLDRCAAGELMCVIFIDLDRFKIINDSLGHETGDEVLCVVAERLSEINRSGDMVGRLAGDEFVVICENLPSVDAATAIAEHVVARLSEPILLRSDDGGTEREASVGASAGIAVADGSTRPEPADLLRDADVAMYYAKQRGQGRVEIFDERLRVAVRDRMELRNELRHGIDAGEIDVYYQPIVVVASNHVVGFEVLARWRHPRRGILGAADFIQVAEESGLIVPLGLAVLRQACLQTVRWRATRPDLHVAVNVSGAQFTDPSFVDAVATVLAETGLAADALWLEITETSLMADAASARQTLDRVRALGVHLALDDFGTGYSSLSYLRQFPVEMLKIDRSFVSGLGDERTDDAIIAMIVALSRTLGLLVVAEGVETDAQLARLSELGCDIAQGYLFDRPAPAERAWFGAPVLTAAPDLAAATRVAH